MGKRNQRLPRYLLVALAAGLLLVPVVCWWVVGAEIVFRSADLAANSLPVAAVFVLMVLLAGRKMLGVVGIHVPAQSLLLIYIMLATTAGLASLGFAQSLIIQLPAPFWRATPENRWQEFADLLPAWATPREHHVLRGFYLGGDFWRPEILAAWAMPLCLWALMLLALTLAMLSIAWLLRLRFIAQERMVFPLAADCIGPSQFDFPSGGHGAAFLAQLSCCALCPDMALLLPPARPLRLTHSPYATAFVTAPQRSTLPTAETLRARDGSASARGVFWMLVARFRYVTIVLIAAASWAWHVHAQIVPASVNVRDFGAKGDGATDDTQAIREAFAAAEELRISEQPVPGQAYIFSAANIFFPNGKYRLSAPITPTANMLGEGNAILYQPDPSTDIISWDWAWRWQISGFTFLGGRHHLNIGNTNVDTGRLIIDRCVFQNASGAAIFIREGSNSTQLTVTNCVFNYCDQVLVNWCDMARVADSWVTTSPTMQGKAVFENHGILLLDHVLGVPLVDPDRDQRWIDDYGGVTCRNVRFGGEGAGFTAVVNWATYDYEYPVVPTFVVLEACQVYCLGNPKRRAAIFCEEIPNQIIVRDCNGFPDLPVLLVSERLDLDTYFDRAAERGEACLRFYIGPEQVELRLKDLPEQMRPYQGGEVWADAPPTKGGWQRGAFIRNRNLEGHWTPQGFVKNPNPAEAEPYGWYCVESGQPGVWKPVYFSFSPPQQ